MSITIIIEITNKLLRHVSSSGSSLVLAKITYECIEMQVVRLKFVKKFIKLIKITNCVCGRICNRCDVAVVGAECVWLCIRWWH